MIDETQTINETANSETLDFISNNKNLVVSNTIVHYACLEYMELYKTHLIPFDYIDYYIRLVGTYEKYFEEELTGFYKDLSNVKNLSISLLASIYSKDIASIAVAVVEKDSIEFIISEQDAVDLLSFYMETETKPTTNKKVYDNFKVVLDEMAKSDELISKKNLFEKYMIDKFLSSYKPKNIIRKKPTPPTPEKKDEKVEVSADKKVTQAVIPSEISILDTDLKGKELEVPEQKGKVVKLFIPKLMLPSPYPYLVDSSRINSDFRSKKLAHADKMIKVFNIYKFKQVIYSNGFLEKRKKVKKPKPKFSFDF